MPRYGLRRESLNALVRELPARALAPLAIAIFAVFSVLGPVIDIFAGGQLALSAVLRDAALSGLVALGYAFGAFRRNYWLFAVTIGFQVAWIALASRGPSLPAAVLANRARLTLDGVLIMIAMVVAYTSFLVFINGTATRYLRIRAEIDLAQGIHQVLVPAIDTRANGYEFFGFSHPSGEVGGDLVDVVSSVVTPGGWFGYVADVSGHGVSSGVVMGMFKSALRMRLRQRGTLAELLADLNTVLMPLKSGSMFVTVACVRCGGPDVLDFAVAGHLPILRVRDGAVEELTTPQIPIAVFENYQFTDSTLEVRGGDLLALLTDGFIEVFDRNDREFGLEPVKLMLRQSGAEPLRDIASRMVAAARDHGKQLDDQTLLLIRRITDVG